MPTRALVVATLLLMLAPAAAGAQKPRPEDYGFQVRADTTGRTSRAARWWCTRLPKSAISRLP